MYVFNWMQILTNGLIKVKVSYFEVFIKKFLAKYAKNGPFFQLLSLVSTRLIYFSEVRSDRWMRRA